MSGMSVKNRFKTLVIAAALIVSNKALKSQEPIVDSLNKKSTVEQKAKASYKIQRLNKTLNNFYNDKNNDENHDFNVDNFNPNPAIEDSLTNADSTVTYKFSEIKNTLVFSDILHSFASNISLRQKAENFIINESNKYKMTQDILNKLPSELSELFYTSAKFEINPDLASTIKSELKDSLKSYINSSASDIANLDIYNEFISKTYSSLIDNCVSEENINSIINNVTIKFSEIFFVGSASSEAKNHHTWNKKVAQQGAQIGLNILPGVNAQLAVRPDVNATNSEFIKQLEIIDSYLFYSIENLFTTQDSTVETPAGVQTFQVKKIPKIDITAGVDSTLTEEDIASILTDIEIDYSKFISKLSKLGDDEKAGKEVKKEFIDYINTASKNRDKDPKSRMIDNSLAPYRSLELHSSDAIIFVSSLYSNDFNSTIILDENDDPVKLSVDGKLTIKLSKNSVSTDDAILKTLFATKLKSANPDSLITSINIQKDSSENSFTLSFRAEKKISFDYTDAFKFMFKIPGSYSNNSANGLNAYMLLVQATQTNFEGTASQTGSDVASSLKDDSTSTKPKEQIVRKEIIETPREESHEQIQRAKTMKIDSYIVEPNSEDFGFPSTLLAREIYVSDEAYENAVAAINNNYDLCKFFDSGYIDNNKFLSAARNLVEQNGGEPVELYRRIYSPRYVFSTPVELGSFEISPTIALVKSERAMITENGSQETVNIDPLYSIDFAYYQHLSDDLGDLKIMTGFSYVDAKSYGKQTANWVDLSQKSDYWVRVDDILWIREGENKDGFLGAAISFGSKNWRFPYLEANNVLSTDEKKPYYLIGASSNLSFFSDSHKHFASDLSIKYDMTGLLNGSGSTGAVVLRAGFEFIYDNVSASAEYSTQLGRQSTNGSYFDPAGYLFYDPSHRDRFEFILKMSF